MICPERNRSIRFGLLFWLPLSVIHATLGIALSLELLFLVPGYSQIFEEFALELPAFTRTVLHASQLAVMYWYLFIPLGAFLLALDCCLLVLLGRVSRIVQSIAGIALAVLLILLGVAIFLAVWLPMTNLHSSLS